MKSIPSLCLATLSILAVMPHAMAQEPEAAASQEAPRAPKAKPFEISHGNLFEALRQMAAYRKLDLVIDPEVPNQRGLYAFKHTTWEKALETLLSSNGLSGEIRDNILHVGLASRFPNELPRSMTFGNHGARTISMTYRPSADGEALLSVSVNGATKAEILEALSKVERLAKAKPDKRAFSANWVLHSTKGSSKDEFETFSMEDVTPAALRALYF